MIVQESKHVAYVNTFVIKTVVLTYTINIIIPPLLTGIVRTVTTVTY